MTFTRRLWIDMGLFETIEKLITEHGSAAILREHLALLRTEFGLLETKNKNLVAETAEHKTENGLLRTKVQQLEQKNRELEHKLDGARRPHSDAVCDHCGSPSLTRTGSRLNATFADLGVKDALFRCDECGKETAVIQVPK
jgi:hypothetical protein